MALFDRVRRAASENFNALLDHLEDPKKDVELTIADMGEQIRLARHEIVLVVAAGKQLMGRVEEAAAGVEKWERRAELAVKHGDDDLAREALRQKRRLVGERERAEQLRAEQHALARSLEADLERMERTLSDVKAKRALLASRLEQVRSGGGPEALGARGSGSAFAEFRNLEAQIEGMEAAIEAQREVNEALAAPRGPTGLSREEVEARFRALEVGASGAASEDVDEELRAIKARVRVEPG